VTYSVATLAYSQRSPRLEPVLTEHDGYVTVEDPVTGVFGSGETVLAAARDFRAALEEHVDVLSRQESLAEPLRHQLAYLLEILKHE
jgi:hypothetical protein